MTKYVEFEAYDGKLCLLSIKEIRRGFARGRRKKAGSRVYEMARKEEIETIRSLVPRLGHRVPLRARGVNKRGRKNEGTASTDVRA